MRSSVVWPLREPSGVVACASDRPLALVLRCPACLAACAHTHARLLVPAGHVQRDHARLRARAVRLPQEIQGWRLLANPLVGPVRVGSVPCRFASHCMQPGLLALTLLVLAWSRGRMRMFGLRSRCCAGVCLADCVLCVQPARRRPAHRYCAPCAALCVCVLWCIMCDCCQLGLLCVRLRLAPRAVRLRTSASAADSSSQR